MSYSDYPILRAEIARTRKGFYQPLLTNNYDTRALKQPSLRSKGLSQSKMK